MAIGNLPSTSQDGETPATAHPPHSLHQHTISNASTVTVDVEAWTTEALASLTISPAARGIGNALSIPIDNDPAPRLKLRNVAFDSGAGIGITPPRRPPSRRDSIKRREELAMGKEGSRQRRRWENDNLVHVPNVQPPLPTDWLVHPTHPVLPTVPYALAQYWDKGLRERVEERKAAFAVHRKKPAHLASAAAPRPDVGNIPRDLRASAKRTPAVKLWLRVLEEPVRRYMVDKGLVVAENVAEAAEASESEEDDEVVFVGRNGSTMDSRAWKKAQRLSKEKDKPVESGMVLDTPGNDETGAFKRFLTHSISEYYGLSSKSVTMGNPARRVVYIGVKQSRQGHAAPVRMVLPPPLWEMF